MWFNIGICLKLDPHDLNAINAETTLSIGDKFNQMILSWLKTMEAHTWKMLCDALEQPTVNLPDIAAEVKAVHMKSVECKCLQVPIRRNK